MTEKKAYHFNLHLPGLLEVLAGSLYSTSKVGLRELIQNAHDSCVRRQIELQEQNYKPCIQINVNKNMNQLTITDNGYGLSEQDINSYLSTIGRSQTKEIKETLEVLSPEDASRLIGQFGFGFLSAFLLSTSVDLITCCAEPGSMGLHWMSSGSEEYSIIPTEKKDVGTSVILTLKPEAQFVFNENALVYIIRKYADFLSIPIYVNGDKSPVNIMIPPWDETNCDEAVKNYLQRFPDLQGNPLHIVCLTNETIDLGHDSIEIPLRGFIYIPRRSIASIHEYGDLSVYIRRMFICDNHNTLMPPWARFMRGVVECPILQPTASRENVHENEYFFAVQQALLSQITRSLRRLVIEDPIKWRGIVQSHSDVIMGWAIRDNDFFSLVADFVHFQTSRGYLTLPEYLKISPGKLYYASHFLGSVQEQLLGEGYDVPVINAYWFAVQPFLSKYASRHPMIELIEIGKNPTDLFRSVSEEPFSKLLAFYRKREVTAKAVSFKPHDVPALMIYPDNAEFIADARKSVDHKEVPDSIARFIENYLEGQETDSEAKKGTLYINASCGLIRQIADHYPDSIDHFEEILVLIYQVARLFGGRMLTPDDVKSSYNTITDILSQLIGKDTPKN
jgi:molecular chaperone HtpG